MANSDEFYIEIRDEVTETIDEFGTTYQVRPVGEYDYDTLGVEAGVTRSISGLAAVNKESTKLSIGSSALSEELSIWLSTKSLIIVGSADIQQGEEIFVDSRWYTTNGIEIIKPADIIICYILDLTR